MTTLGEAVAALHRAITGETGDVAMRVEAAQRDGSVAVEDSNEPTIAAVVALAAGLMAPAAGGVWGWALQDLVPMVPTTELIYREQDVVFVAHGLGRALVVQQGVEESWAVVTWPPPPPKVTCLDTFDPSPEQVRTWAFDPAMRFAEQDEELAVTRPAYLGQLIELAADPSCPKRGLIMRIIDRIVTTPRPDLVETMTRGRDIARATGDVELGRWAEGLDRVLRHLTGTGPVTLDEALAVAKVIMVGYRRPTMVLDRAAIGDWWQLRARYPEPTKGSFDSLYVHQRTGRLVWSWEPLPLESLEASSFDGRSSTMLGHR